jgi:hypothetical protein
MGGRSHHDVPRPVFSIAVSAMNTKQIVAFGWRTASSVLLIVDYFLFSTGNPSLTYSVMGGWFIAPLFAAAIIFAEYGSRAYEGKKERRLFFLYFVVVVATSVTLLLFSGEARQRAIANLESDVMAFVNDPATPKVEASDKTRALMADIKKHPYSMQRDAFIPTFRRMDYIFKAEMGQKYLLVLIMKWNGVPTISLLAQEKNESSKGSE